MAQDYSSINFSPPKGVQAACRRGLKLAGDYGGKGLREETLNKAKRFADGKDNDPAHARKMRAWFARHESDQKPGWDKPPTPGFVANLLWGGDAGNRWASKLVSQMENADSTGKKLPKKRKKKALAKKKASRRT